MVRYGLATGFLCLLSYGATAQNNDAAAISKTIDTCVAMVHQTKLGPDEAFTAQFYKDFDAFYNPASGLIENSAHRNGDTKPLFLFNKCMAARGFPLTKPNAKSPSEPVQKCTEDELIGNANGNCWIKLDPWEKSLLVAGFSVGYLTAYKESERKSYTQRGDSRYLSFVLLREPLRGLDSLYSDPENRSIYFSDALDLIYRQEASDGKNPDIGHLKLLYRQHREPLLSGYLEKFVPPNKVVIREYSDSEANRSMLEQEGRANPTVTVTLIGVGENTPTDRLKKFMDSLANLKNCNTMIKNTDAYAHVKWLKTEADRERYRNTMSLGESSRLQVTLYYPWSSNFEAQFFNQKGELSAEVDLPRTQVVCYVQTDDGQGAKQVPLEDLLLGGRKEPDYGGQFSDNRENFMSLNRFLISNDLQTADDGHEDVRVLAHHLYMFKAPPLPASVTRVIEVGGGSL